MGMLGRGLAQAAVGEEDQQQVARVEVRPQSACLLGTVDEVREGRFRANALLVDSRVLSERREEGFGESAVLDLHPPEVCDESAEPVPRIRVCRCLVED
ncbi:MAG: hypothetical protein L0L30_02135 [Brevibacterium sp.]|nr:hypothetical protein [Brevibacterium sp.]MDN6602842.1 hypothetical protein [Brevibacterium sp.]